MVNEWQELLARRNRTSKTRRLYEDGQPTNKYSWDGIVGTSLHYEEAGEWLEVDPCIVPSDEPGWDWEMVKSHWRFLVRNGGWIGIERGGVGFGFKLIGWTFLNIATKAHDAIRDATYPTPLVSGNELVWANIYPGVDYKLLVGSDGLGYGITISQSARDNIPASPYPAEDTFFVYAYQLKWDDCPYTADADSGDWLDDKDAPHEPRRGVWLVDAIGKVKACLPLGWTVSVGEEEPIELKHRYVKRDAIHYLLIGASWDTLKALPAGDIILSSRIDCGFFEA